MKNLILLFIITPLLAFSQDSVSLFKYCPKKLGQEGALCFAYAPVYTALSIEHNVLNNQTDENSPDFKVFSYGFVASKVKKDKSIFGRAFNKCGRNATVDLALGVLLKTGTVPFSVFSENCDCEKVDDLIQAAGQFKIRDTTIIGDENINIDTHIKNIKEALKQNKPVVIAIFQETFFYNNKNYILQFPHNYKEHKTSANHVVCIIGYNDSINNGSFLIKNNYTNWGQNGFAYVSYLEMIKVIRGSYVFRI
jgi:hypothetical protein